MKITIVQREIEEAVRDFIRTQIDVKEGYNINMEFSATRGEDGLIAAIDISPAPEPTPVKSGARTTRPAATATPAAAPATTSASTVSASAGQDTVAASEGNTAAEATTTEANAGADNVDDTVVDAAAATSVELDPSEVEGDRPLGKSIFGALKRPTNDAEAA